MVQYVPSTEQHFIKQNITTELTEHRDVNYYKIKEC